MPRSAQKNYRDQIRNSLSQSGWEIISIDDKTDWWVDEHWTISSTSQEFGYSLVISFLVDPLYEGHDKSSAICEIVICKTRPPDRLDNESRVAELDMQKGHFATKLDSFIHEINQHRNSLGEASSLD